MRQIKQRKAKNALHTFIQSETDITVYGEGTDQTVGQLIGIANTSMEDDRVKEVCPFCGKPVNLCECSDKATLSASEAKSVTRDALIERLEERGLDVDSMEARENMPQCPVCWKKRYEETLLTTSNVTGDETIFGCQLCLGEYL